MFGADARHRAAGAIALYLVAGIAVVFIDKALISSPGYSIPAPIAVAAAQAAISAGCCFVLGQLSDWFRASNPGAGGGGVRPGGVVASVMRRIPSFQLVPSLVTTTYPLAFTYSLMIAFNNLTLQLVAVSEFNLARSLTILFTVILSFWVLNERLPPAQGVSVCLLLCGYIVGNDGEVHPSIKGLAFGLCSSLCIAANSVGTKVLQGVDGIDGDNVRLTGYVTTSAAPTLAVLSLATGEVATILENVDVLFMPQFWALTLCAGVGSWLIGVAVMLVISSTSPTTYTIVATGKATIQTLAGFVVYKTPTTAQNVLGIVMVLIASLSFAVSATGAARPGRGSAPPP